MYFVFNLFIAFLIKYCIILVPINIPTIEKPNIERHSENEANKNFTSDIFSVS